MFGHKCKFFNTRLAQKVSFEWQSSYIVLICHVTAHAISNVLGDVHVYQHLFSPYNINTNLVVLLREYRN